MKARCELDKRFMNRVRFWSMSRVTIMLPVTRGRTVAVAKTRTTAACVRVWWPLWIRRNDTGFVGTPGLRGLDDTLRPTSLSTTCLARWRHIHVIHSFHVHFRQQCDKFTWQSTWRVRSASAANIRRVAAVGFAVGDDNNKYYSGIDPVACIVHVNNRTGSILLP